MYNILSQEDIANGWKLIMKKRKYKEHIEVNINLSQLPDGLWNKISNENIVIDCAFKYIINKSSNDDKIIELYNTITNKNPQLNIIKELYNECLANKVSGWIMIKANNIIKNYPNFI